LKINVNIYNLPLKNRGDNSVRIKVKENIFKSNIFFSSWNISVRILDYKGDWELKIKL
jgi:hypothetical protein